MRTVEKTEMEDGLSVQRSRSHHRTAGKFILGTNER